MARRIARGVQKFFMVENRRTGLPNSLHAIPGARPQPRRWATESFTNLSVTLAMRLQLFDGGSKKFGLGKIANCGLRFQPRTFKPRSRTFRATVKEDGRG